jgi:sugar lactone lactonase YvrE
MSALAPIRIISARNIVGEGILWNGRRGQLWWTDIQSSRLHEFDWASERLEVHSTPERVGSFGFVAGSERLVTAFASGVALYDVAGKTLDWIARPRGVVAGVRFNDGRVDRRGRFWAGTMVEGPQKSADGCLYSIGRGGSVRCQEQGVRISNGLCMSPDGSKLYFADSTLRTIYVYDLVEPEGLLTNRRIFARTPEGASPDGAAVDADGCVWSAHWGASCIVRYTPEGRVDRTLPVPTSQPSCVCFGGPNLDILCVTSARENLSADRLRAEPHAGSVFLYQSAAQGLPEPEYVQ